MYLQVPLISTARLWDTNGKPIHTLGGHHGEIRSVAFSPDNAFIDILNSAGKAPGDHSGMST